MHSSWDLVHPLPALLVNASCLLTFGRQSPAAAPVARRNVSVAIDGPLRHRGALGRTFPRKPASESRSLAHDVQPWDAFKVATIVSDQRQRVPHRAGGDPQVVIAREPVRATRGLLAALDPRISLTNLKIVGDDSHRSKVFLEKPHLRRPPLSSFCPIVDSPTVTKETATLRS